MISVRRATEADFLAFYGVPPPQTVLGYVGEVDGEIVAIGGLAISGGRAMAFFDAVRDMQFCKIALHKTALKVMSDAARLGYRRVYAWKSEHYPGAGRWLQRLGFRPVDDAVYIWLNS